MDQTDVLDCWIGTATVAWTSDDASGTYREEIVHCRRWLESLVRGGSPVVAARSAQLLLAHRPIPPSSRSALAHRFIQQED